jgi:predicted membrane protein
MNKQKTKAIISVVIAAIILWFIIPFQIPIAVIAVAVAIVWISYRRKKTKAKLDKMKSGMGIRMTTRVIIGAGSEANGGALALDGGDTANGGDNALN